MYSRLETVMATEGTKEYWHDVAVKRGQLADRLEAQVESQRVEIEQLKSAGWRSCIDHIIRPDSPCPVCENERLRALVSDAVEDETEFETEWNKEARALLSGTTKVEPQCPHRNRIGDGKNTEKCLDCGEYLPTKVTK